jgi:hypothetical protein
MTMWRMRIACWIPKSTNTHSEYVVLIALPMQPWLNERASKLRYTYIACLVLCDNHTQYSSEVCAQNGQHLVFKGAIRIVITRV